VVNVFSNVSNVAALNETFPNGGGFVNETFASLGHDGVVEEESSAAAGERFATDEIRGGSRMAMATIHEYKVEYF